VARDDNDEEAHVDPAEKRKLLAEVRLLEVGDKADEAWGIVERSAWLAGDCRRGFLTNNVEHKADEAVIARKDGEDRVDKDNVLEVVDDRLSIEEEVGDREEVPGGSKSEP
jgi:hypothetical protein